MPTIAKTNLPSGNTKTLINKWASMANGDDGESIGFSQYADKSVQVSGTFGAGGTVTIEGSLDGVNWNVLTDPQGNDLNITQPKIEMVIENTLYVRPRVTAGDGTTSLTVVMLMKE